jgi:mediator of RNA polymerase II transcription subunit 13
MGGGQTEISSFKSSPSGLFLIEAPQQVKNVRCHLTSVSSISDFFLSLSKGWSVKSFISSLNKVIKDFKLTPNSSLNQKDSNGSPCTVRVFPSVSKKYSHTFFLRYFDHNP